MTLPNQPASSPPPPGETVIATYNVTTRPRLALSEEWKDVTYSQTVEDLFQNGNISAVARQIATDPHRLLFGQDNLLEFNVTVANIGATNLTNITVDGASSPTRP